MNVPNFFDDLERRYVYKVGVAYDARWRWEPSRNDPRFPKILAQLKPRTIRE